MSADRVMRARGCLTGLAVGDALGGPTEGMSRADIASRWGRVTNFLSDDQTGSDDTEYALFNASLIVRHGSRLSSALIAEAWMAEIMPSAGGYPGAGFSEMLALRNLRAGLRPPESGQHLHAWSDGLAMRVAPFGIVAAQRPLLAADLAAMDGCVSHAGEGIYAGQAVAAAIARAFGASTVEEILTAAREVIPPDSWTRRALDRAVEIGRAHPDVWSALASLELALVPSAYYWSDLGPEAVGLTMGIVVAARGDFRETILGAVNVGRDTDTIAAIAGAIVGALHGIDSIPPEWRGRVGVSQGRCLKAVRGVSIEHTADQLTAISETWP